MKAIDISTAGCDVRIRTEITVPVSLAIAALRRRMSRAGDGGVKVREINGREPLPEFGDSDETFDEANAILWLNRF